MKKTVLAVFIGSSIAIASTSGANFQALAQAPASIYLPPETGPWEGVWRQVTWPSHQGLNTGGRTMYIGATRRLNDRAGFYSMTRRAGKNSIDYVVREHRYYCDQDISESDVLVFARTLKNSETKETSPVWDRAAAFDERRKPRENYLASIVNIEGRRVWWSPRPFNQPKRPWGNKYDRSEVRMGTNGALMQDEVCNSIR